MMEEKKLLVVDRFTIQELITFAAKGSSYEAVAGNHDDLVMNLVLFSWFVTTPFFQDLTNKELKKMLYDEKQRAIEDEIVPPGIFEQATDKEYYVEGGDVWTVVQNTKIY